MEIVETHHASFVNDNGPGRAARAVVPHYRRQSISCATVTNWYLEIVALGGFLSFVKRINPIAFKGGLNRHEGHFEIVRIMFRQALQGRKSMRVTAGAPRLKAVEIQYLAFEIIDIQRRLPLGQLQPFRHFPRRGLVM